MFFKKIIQLSINQNESKSIIKLFSHSDQPTQITAKNTFENCWRTGSHHRIMITNCNTAVFSLCRSIIKNDSEAGSQVCFGDADSSVGSVSGGGGSGNHNADGRCAAAGGAGCGGAAAVTCAGKSGGGGGSSSELPSIVERNARIIKWLWNCRKANLQQTPPPPPFSPTWSAAKSLVYSRLVLRKRRSRADRPRAGTNFWIHLPNRLLIIQQSCFFFTNDSLSQN